VFEYYNAHRQQAEDHSDRAAAFAPDKSTVEYGSARATRAYLAYMKSDYQLVGQCAVDATRIAQETGDAALGVRSGLVEALSGLAVGVAGARERAVDLIDEAKARNLDELASTGYSSVSYMDVEQRRLRGAERVLEESLPFTVARDIPICNHWQTAVRSRLRLLEGRWSAALEDADDVLTRVGMPLATLWPHLLKGLVPLRRTGAVNHHLEAAWDIANRLDEPLRRLPVLSAFAERMWLTGTPDHRITSPAHVEVPPATGWVAGDLAVWLWRLGLDGAVDTASIAEPYRLTLTGRHEEAAEWWRQAGAVFEEAMANADSADVGRRVQGIERLDLLGATAVADRLRHMLRQQGIAQLPARPRTSTRANPAGLTNRQLDVAKLVARGFTNAEIADRLFISVKTADHHVSAVLTKLGMPNRRAVVVRASDLGFA
jgi:DNA-binding CsgD family transcriptional regulator